MINQQLKPFQSSPRHELIQINSLAGQGLGLINGSHQLQPSGAQTETGTWIIVICRLGVTIMRKVSLKIAELIWTFYLDFYYFQFILTLFVSTQLSDLAFPSVLIPFSLIKKGMEHIKMVKTVTKCFHKYQYFMINPSRGNKLE